jgi:hypothetical protein
MRRIGIGSGSLVSSEAMEGGGWRFPQSNLFCGRSVPSVRAPGQREYPAASVALVVPGGPSRSASREMRAEPARRPRGS